MFPKSNAVVLDNVIIIIILFPIPTVCVCPCVCGAFLDKVLDFNRSERE